VPSGSIDATTNGALIENVDVTGNIDIDAEARNAVARRISAGHESALLFTWAIVP
jgi:hypothetical protein